MYRTGNRDINLKKNKKMELNIIKIGEVNLCCLNKFYKDTSEVSIVRIFELNEIKYISFVDDSDPILKTLSIDKFADKFEPFLNSLFVPENTPNMDDSDCECVNCK